MGGLKPRFELYGPTGTQEMMDCLFGPKGACSRDLTARTNHPVSLKIFQSRGGGKERPWPDTQAIEIDGGSVVRGDDWTLEAMEVIHHQRHHAPWSRDRPRWRFAASRGRFALMGAAAKGTA